jgi:hypothetical protein
MGCGTCSGGCTADGTRINPADYRGKAVLLAFGLPGVAGGRLESNDALGKQYNLRQGGKIALSHRSVMNKDDFEAHILQLLH